MQSMPQEPGTARPLHLDVSENNLEKGHDAFVATIAKDCAPTQLSMRRLIYDHGESLRKLLLALANNRSIRKLDLTKLSSPSEASPDTIAALEHFFIHNQTLEELDLTGEPQTRLDPSKLGEALRQAFVGLNQNTKLHTLWLNNQKLGNKGTSTLADMLKENSTLQRIICEHKDIKLHDLTDLVNAVVDNTTVLFVGSFDEGRVQALRRAQEEILKDKTKSASTTNLKQLEGSSLRRTFTALTISSSSAKETKPGRALTEQDATAAINILKDKWDEQIRRLNGLLQRNFCLHTGQPMDPLDMQVQGADNSGRPGTADSLAQIFQQVKDQTTPTSEYPTPISTPRLHPTPLKHKASSILLRSPPASPRSKASQASHRAVRAMRSTLSDRTASFTSETSHTSRPEPAISPAAVERSATHSPASLLDDVEIDTTPIFSSTDTFGLQVSNPDTPTDLSPTLTREGSSGEPEVEDEGLMMARSPPRQGREGLGLEFGGIAT